MLTRTPFLAKPLAPPFKLRGSSWQEFEKQSRGAVKNSIPRPKKNAAGFKPAAF
jgi:hypothetical protein